MMQRANRLVIDFSNAETPKRVFILTKDEFVETPVDQIEKDCEFRWIESLATPKYLKYNLVDIPMFNLTGEGKNIRESQVIPAAYRSGKKNAETIEHYLENSQVYSDQLALTEKTVFGHGVCAREKIQPNQFLTIYTGETKETTNEKNLTHHFGTELCQRAFWSSSEVYTNGIIDAKRMGNIARFFQHAPLIEELKEANLPGVDINDVCTTNTISFPAIYKGRQVVCIISNAEIKPKENIFIYYGQEYWKNKTFTLFNKKGEAIAEVQYENGKLVRAKKELNVHPASLFYNSANNNSKVTDSRLMHPAALRM